MAFTSTENECDKLKVGIVGSGNWGSTVAKVVGQNVQALEAKYERDVQMYMHEEMYGGAKLTETFNATHENAKYLPGVKIPENVVATSDIVSVVGGADVLVFVLPHQFVEKTIAPAKGQVKESAVGITLCKGFIADGAGEVRLVSDVVSKTLGLEMSSLMGANIAEEIANENLAEATIGCDDPEASRIFIELFSSPYLKVHVVPDVKTVELCGALKNVVAVGAGLVDGLGGGNNTKAAVIRLGLMEMMKYSQAFYASSRPMRNTFLESCGFGDLITTCFGGRNRECAEAFAKGGTTFEQIEREKLNGQKLQGPLTAKETYQVISKNGRQGDFPLFCTIHSVCTGEISPKNFVSELKKHDWDGHHC